MATPSITESPVTVNVRTVPGKPWSDRECTATEIRDALRGARNLSNWKTWYGALRRAGHGAETVTAAAEKHVARQVAPVHRPSLAERFEARILATFEAEIGRRGGETGIETERGEVGLQILAGRGRQTGERLYLLGCDGWRYYSRRFGSRPAAIRYLCGWTVTTTGARVPWAVRVPGTCCTVAGALGAVTPAAVRTAQAVGRRVLRQGDVWIVEVAHDQTERTAADLPRSHRWNPKTRYLTHAPADGHRHPPVKVAFPAKFVPATALAMGRTARRGAAD